MGKIIINQIAINRNTKYHVGEVLQIGDIFYIIDSQMCLRPIHATFLGGKLLSNVLLDNTPIYAIDTSLDISEIDHGYVGIRLQNTSDIKDIVILNSIECYVLYDALIVIRVHGTDDAVVLGLIPKDEYNFSTTLYTPGTYIADCLHGEE